MYKCNSQDTKEKWYQITLDKQKDTSNYQPNQTQLQLTRKERIPLQCKRSFVYKMKDFEIQYERPNTQNKSHTRQSSMTGFQLLSPSQESNKYFNRDLLSKQSQTPKMANSQYDFSRFKINIKLRLDKPQFHMSSAKFKSQKIAPLGDMYRKQLSPRALFEQEKADRIHGFHRVREQIQKLQEMRRANQGSKQYKPQLHLIGKQLVQARSRNISSPN